MRDLLAKSGKQAPGRNSRKGIWATSRNGNIGRKESLLAGLAKRILGGVKGKAGEKT